MTKFTIQDECEPREVNYETGVISLTKTKTITDTGSVIQLNDCKVKHIIDYCDFADLVIAFYIFQNMGHRFWSGKILKTEEIANVLKAKR
jgi:hypothetical protein